VAPQDDLAEAKGQFTKGTDDLGKGARDIDKSFGELIAKGNKVIKDLNFIQDMWFGDEVDAIRGLFVKVGDDVKRLLELLGKVLGGSIPVFSLFDAAFEWVAEPVSSSVVTAKEPAGWSLRAWEGPAALAYLEIRASQSDAIKGLATASGDIGTWLIGVGQSNVKFMLDLVVPVVEFAKSLAAAIVAAVTVAGLLEAIGKLADAVGALLAAFWKIVHLSVDKAADTISRAHSAQRILSGNAPFPGGKWPNPVTV